MDPQNESTSVSTDANHSRVPFWSSFGRAQVSSFLATAVDYGTFFSLTELAGLYYVVSSAIGALLGAITNFSLNRHWSFEVGEKPMPGQAFRYALVSGISLSLNTFGVYGLTEWGGLKYGYSKVLASLLVGFFFNFPLHRRYVFK